MDYKEIIKKSIDLHVHVGPELIPRKFTLEELVKYESGKISGVCVKSHFFPINFSNRGNALKDFIVIRSLTLNNCVGGFNSDAVRIAADMSTLPIIVWFPTINANNFIAKNKSEAYFKLAGQDQIPFSGLSVLDVKSGILKKEVVDVLEMIKSKGSILATGHISWQEARALVEYAIDKMGIKKVIITHPVYNKIKMPLSIQKKLAKKGAFIEFCYFTYKLDKIPIEKIAKQIQSIGADRCIISSDVGQVHSKSPSEVLEEFMILLEKEGLSKEDFTKMMIKNPNSLLFDK